MAVASSNPQSPSSDGSWQAVIDAAVPAIVALQVTAVRGFQDDTPGAHGGTGFVVDAKLGLLLTNRHVCTCGPERASASFVGCPATEELRVTIAYLDPVHDFAFLRFNPKDLQHTPLVEIELDPSGCRVGEEIRVVGNDSLEKLQILSGTIARVDRNAPELDGDFNDENTFYALAASGTRGGSSGSPVLNRQGRAVALNAAANCGSMQAFYLPLHRVVRALEAVRAGEKVPRGTICTAFTYISFPECLRLGVDKTFVQKTLLQGDSTQMGTFSKAHPPGGLLQVRRCIPGTLAAESLQPGDVLLEVAGQLCADFVLFDHALDSSVGGKVKLALCRGGQKVEVELPVQDLHCLIPHAFIELGLGVFHEVPYQTAQKNHVPLHGIYVATAGFVFGQAVKSDSVIVEINGNPCLDLRSFEDAIQQIPDKEYFHVAWNVPSNAKERRRCEGTAKMQRHWGTARAWDLDGQRRQWMPRQLRVEAEPETVANGQLKRRCSSSGSRPVKKRASRCKKQGAAAALESSLCLVTFRTVQHFELDLASGGESTENDILCRRGAGVIVDAEAGLVLTDRYAVPQLLGDVEVTLGDETRSASVWFVHPVHSLVVLRVAGCHGSDGKPFGEAALFKDRTIEVGEELDFVGIDEQGRRLSQQVHVQAVRLGRFPSHWPPKWHERNLEAVVLADAPELANNGVLCSGNGQIHALYTITTVVQDQQVHRLGYGLPVHAMASLLRQLKVSQGPLTAPVVPSLEVQFQAAELLNLRRLPAKLRPSEKWMAQLAATRGASGVSSALAFEAITSRGPCDGVALEGDLLVAIDGQVVTTVKEVEARLEAVAFASKRPLLEPVQVQLTLLRRGQELQVEVSVPMLGSDGARRVLGWHGLVLQETPRAVREIGPVPLGVHISQTMLGSPAEAFGIEGEFIVAVNGTPTPNLDSLLELRHGVETMGHCKQRHLRIESADTSGRHYLKTLEPDPLFWPTFEMRQDSKGAWSFHELE